MDIIEVDINSNSNSALIEAEDNLKSDDILFFENLFKNRDKLYTFKEDIIKYILTNIAVEEANDIKLNVPNI